MGYKTALKLFNKTITLSNAPTSTHVHNYRAHHVPHTLVFLPLVQWRSGLTFWRCHLPNVSHLLLIELSAMCLYGSVFVYFRVNGGKM